MPSCARRIDATAALSTTLIAGAATSSSSDARSSRACAASNASASAGSRPCTCLHRWANHATAEASGCGPLTPAVFVRGLRRSVESLVGGPSARLQARSVARAAQLQSAFCEPYLGTPDSNGLPSAGGIARPSSIASLPRRSARLLADSTHLAAAAMCGWAGAPAASAGREAPVDGPLAGVEAAAAPRAPTLAGRAGTRPPCGAGSVTGRGCNVSTCGERPATTTRHAAAIADRVTDATAFRGMVATSACVARSSNASLDGTGRTVRSPTSTRAALRATRRPLARRCTNRAAAAALISHTSESGSSRAAGGRGGGSGTRSRSCSCSASGVSPDPSPAVVSPAIARAGGAMHLASRPNGEASGMSIRLRG